MYSKIYRLPAVSLYCQERAGFVEFPLAPPYSPCSPSGLGTCTPAIHSIYNRAPRAKGQRIYYFARDL